MDELMQRDLRDARRALEDALHRRAELRQECESAVVQWRWAPGDAELQRPEPLFRERFGVPVRRLLEQAPAVPRDEQQYGFDADGSIIVVRQYVSPGSFREELRVPRGETVVGHQWSETGAVSEVNIARYAAGRMRSNVTVWPDNGENFLHGSVMERYDYDGDLVTEIHTEMIDAIGDRAPQRSLTRVQASYDPLGRLLELVEHDDKGEKVLYRARAAGPSMDKLQRRVEDRLVQTLPKLVLGRVGDEPIYCLVLHYEREWPLPPTVGLGLQRERQAWVDAFDDAQTLKLTVWNPAEFSNYAAGNGGTANWDLTAVDPELARAVRTIPENDEGAPERARATLNRAAARLQRLDWPLITPVTDDFVVFAVDYELIDLDENLCQSVPARLRKALSEHALI